MNPNPTPEVTPFGWVTLAAIAAGAAVLWWTRPAKASAAPAACAVDVQKLHAWGLSRGTPVFYFFATDAPPSFEALPSMGVSVGELLQDFVVVLKDGSFWTYPDETPVAAPALRAEYCAFTS